MVPLAPHPCVRWWNTEEMPLKLTRLDLHSLRGGSSHQKPSYPVGQMSSPARPTSSRKPPTKAAWIPTNKERYSTHSTAVAQGGPRVAQTQAAEDRRIAQRILPEKQPNKIGPPSCCTAPPQDFHWSTIFFFGVQNHFFFCSAKEKVVLAPAGQAKNNCKIKASHFSHKRKGGFTRKMHTLSVRRRSRATSAHPFRKPPTQAAWISTNKERYSSRSTAVAQGGPRVAQTHAAGNKRGIPESFTRGIP